jgi:hypothetical protein
MAKAKVGEPFDPVYGVTWCDGNANDGPPRGYYANVEGPSPSGDAETDYAVRLRWVDDAPGNPEDGSGHFEVMPREAGYGYYHGVGGSAASGGALGVSAPVPVPVKIVPLEASVEGKAKTAAAAEPSIGTKIRYLLNGKR